MHTTNLNFHTFTSHPFILTKRSTFILALHQFSIQFSSTHSPPHSLTPLPHKRPNSPLFPSTLQNTRNSPFPSTFNSITPPHSSLSPFQHPFNNHLPSASNHKNLPSHQHQHALTNPPHPSSPIRQSISNSPPKRKHNTRTPLPAFHHSSQFKRKQPNASLQPHDSQTVGGATLDLWLAPFGLM